MSTLQTIPSTARTRPTTSSLIATGLGVLIAVAVTVLILALTGAKHRIPAPISHASTTTHYTRVYVRSEKSTALIPAQAGTASTAASPAATHVYVRQDRTYEALP